MLHFTKHGQIEGTNIDSGREFLKYRSWSMTIREDATPPLPPGEGRPPGGGPGGEDGGGNGGGWWGRASSLENTWPYYHKLIGIIRQSLGQDAPSFDESFALGLLDALENGPFDDGIRVYLDGTWKTDTEIDEEISWDDH